MEQQIHEVLCRRHFDREQEVSGKVKERQYSVGGTPSDDDIQMSGRGIVYDPISSDGQSPSNLFFPHLFGSRTKFWKYYGEIGVLQTRLA